MPRNPPSLDKLPAVFLELAKRLYNDRQPIRVELPSQSAAITLRMRLYRFRTSLLACAHQFGPAARFFHEATFSIERNVLHIYPPEASPGDAAILAALAPATHSEDNDQPH